MKDMKLIMETWRKFEDTVKDKETHVFLFENKKPVKTNFNVLLEQYDNKQLTEDRLIKLWEDSFNYEYEQLLKEIDWEKEAELTADPDYKPPQERKVGIAEKINDMLLKVAMQARSMIEKGGGLAIRVIGKAAGLMKRFAENHPVMAKIVIAVMMAAFMYALMGMLDPQEAMAKIKVGDKILTNDEVDMVRGSFGDLYKASVKANAADPSSAMAPFSRAVGDQLDAGIMEEQVSQILKLAHMSPEEISVDQLSEMLPKELQKAGQVAEATTKYVNAQIEQVADMRTDLLKMSKSGDESVVNKALDILNREYIPDRNQLSKWKGIIDSLRGAGRNLISGDIPMPSPETFGVK